MNVRNLATKLAAVPEQAIDALSSLPSLPANPWRPQRSWAAGQSIAAFGLGLAAGVAIGMLFFLESSSEADPDSRAGRHPIE